MLTTLPRRLRGLPTPMAGLALGVASLGWCMENALPLNGWGQLIGAFTASALLLLLVLRFILHAETLWEDLKHPVVGSIVADAASTVTSSAAILRSGIGVVGVVSVAAMCVTPYLQFVMHYVLYKLAAGIAESFADKRVGRLIDGFADVYGFLLGMVGVASLILFLSIVSSMKAVTG